MNPRILVVEDDASLATVLCDNLSFEGFDVEHARNGDVAISLARSFAPDLVLLDLMLPGTDGLELCRFWRERSRMPVIMLTARARKEDKLHGLKVGADDYVTKPFDVEELMARIHAVLRRARPAVNRITLGDVTVDFSGCRTWRGEVPIELSHREYLLLRYLVERPNSIVHRDELLLAVWGFPDTPHTRCVDNAIARLRRKLEDDPHHPRFIHTVYGDGYQFSSSGSAHP